MIDLILILTVGILGVLQGGALELPYVKAVARVLTGVCFCYALAQLHPAFWMLVARYFFEYAPGVGQPEGLARIRYKRGDIEAIRLYSPDGSYGSLEHWQTEWLRFREWYSLAYRGAFFYNPFHIIGNPLGMWLALRTPEFKWMDTGRWHEAYHPMIVMVLTLGLIQVLN